MSDNHSTPPSVCIFGAGSIGCYVGGCLLAGGAEVSFVGREHVGGQLRRDGLRVSDWRGLQRSVAAGAIRFSTEPAVAAEAQLVIVSVKSADTAAAAEQLAAVLAPQTVVLSLQNGLRNAERLREALPHNTVLAGMISCNVLSRGEGRFHAGSEGGIMAEPHPLLDRLAPLLSQCGLPLEQRRDIVEVQWAKLLMNLNNAVNALSGMPLKEELSRRDYRRCLALLIEEALALMSAAGIAPARVLPLPMRWLPTVLRLPDWLFTRLAQQLLAIDPLARSSMWEDLQRGRATEVDSLNGEVLKLAEALGQRARRNERIVELVRRAEAGDHRKWPAAALLAELRAAE